MIWSRNNIPVNTNHGIRFVPLGGEYYQLVDLVERRRSTIIQRQDGPFWLYRSKSTKSFGQRVEDAHSNLTARYGALKTIGLINFEQSENAKRMVIEAKLTQHGYEVLHVLERGFVYNFSYGCLSITSTREYWINALQNDTNIDQKQLQLIAKLPMAQFKTVHNAALHRKLRSTLDEKTGHLQI